MPGELTARIDLDEAYSGFTIYLRDERGRSPHTVRAYLADLRDLFNFAIERGCNSPTDLLCLYFVHGWHHCTAEARRGPPLREKRHQRGLSLLGRYGAAIPKPI